MSRSLDKYAAMLRVDDRSASGEVTTPMEVAVDMIAKIPEECFVSNSTTFLDPFFGNGTFLFALIEKLCSYGHSMKNIEKRIYGCELSKRLANKVKKKLAKYKFDNIIEGDSLEKDWNMKFDVVIGNPPYQADGESKRWIKWVKFIEYGKSICNKHLVYVTPSSWLGPGEGHDLVFSNLVYANLNCDKYFNVGSTFSWYRLDMNSDNSTSTFVKAGGEEIEISNDSKFLSTNSEMWAISKKFFTEDTFDFNRTTEHHTSSRKDWEAADGKYEVFHTHAQTFHSNVAPTRYNYEGYKVFMTLSGYPKAFARNNIALSQIGAWMEISEEEVAGAESVFNSKLYQAMLATHKWSGWNSLDVIKSLPKVDLNKVWTDEDLYSHFNLTEEEIVLIEEMYD